MSRKNTKRGITVPVGVAGQYKFSKILATGEVVDVTDWFSNLITDSGLDGACGDLYNTTNTLDMRTTALIGTGTSSPDITDTSLSQFVGSTSNKSSYSSESGGSPDYWWQVSTTYQFAESLEGNFTEVGISSHNDPDSNFFQLWSRELIRDSQGEPTTITVLADEILQVTYRLRIYPPLEDVEGTFTLNDVEYNYILRAADVDTFAQWGAGGGTGNVFGIYTNTSTGYVRKPIRAWDGDIGSITEGPAGTHSNRSSVSLQDYERGSFEKFARAVWGLSSANFDNGIRSVNFSTHSASSTSIPDISGYGAYQIQFDPPIPKDDTLVFEIVVGMSIGRYQEA